MKNLLIATTAIVATAGMASAEVTFSGKGEAGMYRTGKTDAGTAVVGVKATASAASASNTKIVQSATGIITTTAATGTAAQKASTAQEKADAYQELTEKQDLLAAAKQALLDASTTETIDQRTSDIATSQMNLALATALYNKVVGSAGSAAVKTSDMAAYSGYDMNVAVSAESDNGIVFGMGFDMGAGLIADQNDDRAMDTQGAVIGTSALTATMSGYTLSIGSDKLDDVYDDTQNGDIGLSGNVGGVAFNLVHDVTDEVVAKGATFKAASATRTVAAGAYTAAGAITSSTTINAGDSDYVAATWSDAVAATVETTSLSLGGATGAISWSLASTTGNDAGDSAAKGSLTYTGMENLSLTLAHDNAGKLEGITKVTAKYTMGSLTATLSMADDKDHKGNKNKSKKASSNLSLAYAANGLSTTFATDESSQWWVNTQYDLGGGAQAFATIDHTEFAVVGLNFNF